MEKNHDKLGCILELVRDCNSTLKRIESRGKSWHINSIPSDDVRDSKIIEEVDIIHNDTDVEASIESSPPIPDDTYVYESSTSDFEHETEVDSTAITTGFPSPSLSLEFIVMIHPVPSSFNSCLEFVSGSNLSLVGFDVCPPRRTIYSLFSSLGVIPTGLHLPVTHDNIIRQLANYNDNCRFFTC